MIDNLVLTFDLDWCNDEILSYLLDKLIPSEIPATFFVTHKTSLLETIRKYDFFELGIHPNFNKNSSHGVGLEDVIDYCLDIVPEAVSSRSHCLNISSNILVSLMKKGIKIEASTIMPNISELNSFCFEMNDKKILRVPFNWEDDYEFFQRDKKFRYDSIKYFRDKILNFHPIHIYLNSESDINYLKYKNEGAICKNKNLGAENMLNEIIQLYTSHNIRVYNLKSLFGG